MKIIESNVRLATKLSRMVLPGLSHLFATMQLDLCFCVTVDCLLDIKSNCNGQTQTKVGDHLKKRDKILKWYGDIQSWRVLLWQIRNDCFTEKRNEGRRLFQGQDKLVLILQILCAEKFSVKTHQENRRDSQEY